MRIAYSSGHGKKIRGASDILDEVDEARRVVERTAELLRSVGVTVMTFHDDVSTNQSDNLNRIVAWHNSQTRDYDLSQHFNAYSHTSKPMGVEVLFVTQESLARKVSAAIAKAGSFIDRGPKYRSDLAFLNRTSKPSILLETCFVDSVADADLYHRNFESICRAIAESLSGVSIPDDGGGTPPPEPEEPEEPTDIPVESRPMLRRGNSGPDVVDLQEMLPFFGGEIDGDFGPVTESAVIDYQRSRGLAADGIVGQQTWGALYADTPPVPQPPTEALAHFSGKCSWFGGPDDTGVSPSEGLAFIYDYDAAPHLFLPQQPPGTTGLARRLNPDVFYVACRWDYNITPKTMLDDKDKRALVRAKGREFLAWPADWGPHQDTGRVADISPGLMESLGIKTDDVVEVIYPAPPSIRVPEV
jgi:hypothetical protein